jgi:hypothetical protein
LGKSVRENNYEILCVDEGSAFMAWSPDHSNIHFRAATADEAIDGVRRTIERYVELGDWIVNELY